MIGLEPRIKKIRKPQYVEIRDCEGGSSRGTGTYNQKYYTAYRIGNKEFTDVKDAKRYLKSIDNAPKIKKLKAQYKKLMNKSKTLDKEIEKISNAIYKLGSVVKT